MKITMLRLLRRIFVRGSIALFASTLSLPSFAAHSETGGKKFGLGFVLGAPTALSGRYQLSEDRGLDLQFAFNSSDYVLLYGDYLIQFRNLFHAEEKFVEQLTPYLGVGPVLAFASKSDHPKNDYFNRTTDTLAFGVRVPFGIEWLWDRVPIGVGLELAPGVVVAPATEGFIQIGLTFHYYF